MNENPIDLIDHSLHSLEMGVVPKEDKDFNRHAVKTTSANLGLDSCCSRDRGQTVCKKMQQIG
jgi:hypothetical protein